MPAPAQAPSAADTLVLLTTTIADSPGYDRLTRLQSHLHDEVTQRGLHLRWYVLVQGSHPDRNRPAPAFAHMLYQDDVCGLSEARNRLLQASAQSDEPAAAIVGFPDDDAWHPAGLLTAIVQEFSQHPSLDMWFCRYGSQPHGFAAGCGRTPSTSDVVRNASSNTLFVRSKVAQGVGLFDERLGLGSPLGGAEDLDYALRCLALARDVAYVPRAMVGHRDKAAAQRADYYLSSALVLRRHRDLPGLRREFIRKIAVGCALSARGEISPALVWQSISSRLLDDRDSSVASS